MPFTHVDSQTSQQQTPAKRKSDFPEPRRSPPAFRDIVPPVTGTTTTTSIPRLTSNPYAADPIPTISQSQSQSQRTVPTMPTPGAARGSQSLPSIRDMVPELPARGTPWPAASNQECGPDSFRPSGPTIRPAATGLAPAPLSSSRISPYTTPETTPSGVVFSDRNYASSLPSGSRSTTSRNSPIQPLAYRSEPIQALPPPSSASFRSSEASRAGPYTMPLGMSSNPPT